MFIVLYIALTVTAILGLFSIRLALRGVLTGRLNSEIVKVGMNRRQRLTHFTIGINVLIVVTYSLSTLQ